MATASTQSAADLLASWYGAAAARARQIILHPPGKTAGTQSWQRARSAQSLVDLQKLLNAIDEKAAAQIGKGISKAVSTGIRQANAQLAKAGLLSRKNALMGSFGIIDSAAIGLIAKNTAKDVLGVSSSIEKMTGRVLKKIQEYGLGEAEINRIIAGGMIDGAPRQAIATLRKDLERVNKGKMVEVINKNGEPMYFQSDEYSRMVYVTKTSEASTKSQHMRFQQEDIDLVQIIGNQTKYFCSEYLGSVYSLSGDSKRYPALSSLPGGGPPFHPNCSKSTIAFIEELNG